MSASFKVWNKKLRFRDVVLSAMKVEFHAWITHKGEDPAQGNIGSLQLQLTEFIETKMTKEQKSKIEALREEWEDDVYPMDLRIKNYEKSSSKANLSVDRAFYQKMGEFRLTFVGCHKTPDRMQVEMIDNMGEILTFKCMSIEEKFPTEVAAFYTVWQQYISYVRSQEKSASTGNTETAALAAPQLKRSHRKPYISLPQTHSGIPLIPEKSLTATGATARQSMRAYIAAQYARAGGKDAPPYNKMSTNMTEFISSECCPSGFQMKDPSQLTAEAAIAFCDHIRTRQGALPAEDVFRFVRVCSGRLSSTIVDATYMGNDGVESDPEAPVINKKRKRATKKKPARVLNAEAHPLPQVPQPYSAVETEVQTQNNVQLQGSTSNILQLPMDQHTVVPNMHIIPTQSTSAHPALETSSYLPTQLHYPQQSEINSWNQMQGTLGSMHQQESSNYTTHVNPQYNGSVTQTYPPHLNVSSAEFSLAEPSINTVYVDLDPDMNQMQLQLRTPYAKKHPDLTWDTLISLPPLQNNTFNWDSPPFSTSPAPLPLHFPASPLQNPRELLPTLSIPATATAPKRLATPVRDVQHQPLEPTVQQTPKRPLPSHSRDGRNLPRPRPVNPATYQYPELGVSRHANKYYQASTTLNSTLPPITSTSTHSSTSASNITTMISALKTIYSSPVKSSAHGNDSTRNVPSTSAASASLPQIDSPPSPPPTATISADSAPNPPPTETIPAPPKKRVFEYPADSAPNPPPTETIPAPPKKRVFDSPASPPPTTTISAESPPNPPPTATISAPPKKRVFDPQDQSFVVHSRRKVTATSKGKILKTFSGSRK